MPNAVKRDRSRLERMLERERGLHAAGYRLVAGVDEAGRGPLAGPVVAAAAILDLADAAVAKPEFDWLADIFDSKQLSATGRETLYELIMAEHSPFHVGIGMRDHEAIDRINILRATFEAMSEAVGGLDCTPDFVLVDGTRTPEVPMPSDHVVKGDSRCVCIAAASIVAKVTRDRIMTELARTHPEYGFDGHKGYGTKEHIEAIRRHGRSAVHRRSFKVARVDQPGFWDDTGGGAG